MVIVPLLRGRIAIRPHQKGLIIIMPDLVIRNIGVLATPIGVVARRGPDQGHVLITNDAWLSVDNGLISGVGVGAAPDGNEVFDAGGKLVTPGLVDPHTHLVFGGWREHELAMKLGGVPYLDILASGGGILSTVNSTREASAQELTEKALSVLERMLSLGVTTCGAKSGYGLDPDTELKLLHVVDTLKVLQPIELISTFMGAHAVPPEFTDNRRAYIDLLVNEMIPAFSTAGLAEFCDVFCETGAFSSDEALEILLAGKTMGLEAKCHCDELNAIGGTEMAAAIGAVSCEHLIKCSSTGIDALHMGGSIACLLPATSFYLGEGYAPARELINAGVPVAFGSDFNPGTCPSFSLQLAMCIGCFKYRMTPGECLTAVTLNAAAAVCRADRLGSLEVGKQADFVIWDAPNLDYLFYRFGDNLAHRVFVCGARV